MIYELVLTASFFVVHIQVNLGVNNLTSIPDGWYGHALRQTLVCTRSALVPRVCRANSALTRHQRATDTCRFDHILKLEKVLLSNNELTRIPVIRHRSVRHLLIAHNRLTVVKAGVFAGVPSLDHLDLEHNPLVDIETGALSAGNDAAQGYYNNPWAAVNLTPVCSSAHAMQPWGVREGELRRNG